MKKQSSVSASWILPIDSPAMSDGCINWNNHAIESVVKDKSDTYHYNNAIILPGLINTHAHLELGGLRGKTKKQIPFTRWADELRELITPFTMNDFLNFTEAGLQEALETGTTTIADVGFSNANISSPKSRIRLWGHKELIGMNSAAADTIYANALAALALQTETTLSHCGLSVHAPFSCSPELIAHVIEHCYKKSTPFIMHLAESYEEQEHYSMNEGSMLEFLKSRFFDYTLKMTSKNSIDYCLSNNLIPDGSLLIHANYSSKEHLATLAQKKCAISHCPRSRSFFDHKEFPFKDALASGITLSIGTDSLASNYSLNMWEELNHLYSLHSDILSPQQCITMATINGAKALNLDKKIGTLTPGKYADFIVVQPNENSGDPYLDLVTSPPDLLLSVVDGIVVYEKNREFV